MQFSIRDSKPAISSFRTYEGAFSHAWNFEDFLVYFIEVLVFYCYRIIPGNFAGARNSIHFLGFVNSVTMNNKACAVFVVTKGRETMPCIFSRSFIQSAGRDGFHSRCYPNA